MNKKGIQDLRSLAQAEAARITRVRAETLKKQVRHYMAAMLQPHIDPVTGEVNATTLAVEAAVGLDHPDWLDDNQHFVWDLAVDMAEAYKGRDDK